MDIDQYVYSEGALRLPATFSAANVGELLKYLGDHPKITILSLQNCSDISDAGIKAIVENKSAGHLERLFLPEFDNPVVVGNKGVGAIGRIVRGIMGRFRPTKISDVTLQAIANSEYMQNLTYLSMGGNHVAMHPAQLETGIMDRFRRLVEGGFTPVKISDVGLKSIANSKYMQSLTHLDLKNCSEITDVRLRTAGSKLRNLQMLNLLGCTKLIDKNVMYTAQRMPKLSALEFFFPTAYSLKSDVPPKFIEMVVEKMHDSLSTGQFRWHPGSGWEYPVDAHIHAFMDGLRKIQQDISGSNTKKIVEEMVFGLAQQKNVTYLKHILDHPGKYPFLINSVENYSVGKHIVSYTVEDFYPRAPEMRKFFFEHGLLPEPSMFDLAGSQSVHNKDAENQMRFFIIELKNTFNKQDSELDTQAKTLESEMKSLLSEISSIKISKSERNDICAPIFGPASTATPETKEAYRDLINGPSEEFVEEMLSTVNDTLTAWLKKDPSGKYTHDKSVQTFRYNYEKENDAGKIHDSGKINLPHTIGLIKLLIDQQTGEGHDAKKEKLLEFAKGVFAAAITYGGGQNAACFGGTLEQVVSTVQLIDLDFLDKYQEYIAPKLDTKAIDANNVDEVVKVISSKIIEDAEKTPETKAKLLSDALMTSEESERIDSIPMFAPQEVTLKQQTLLSMISTALINNIRFVLPNYPKDQIPTLTELVLVVQRTDKSEELQKWALSYELPERQAAQEASKVMHNLAVQQAKSPSGDKQPRPSSKKHSAGSWHVK